MNRVLADISRTAENLYSGIDKGSLFQEFAKAKPNSLYPQTKWNILKGRLGFAWFWVTGFSVEG
jgi:hypothetical protein